LANNPEGQLMKFRSEQGILAEALGALARIASSRNAGTPALAGVKMVLTGDSLVASSTDQDISLQFTIPVGGDTDGQGLVSARMLNDIVRVMPSGKITVEFAGDNATISAQRSQFTVPTLNAVDFPRTTNAGGEPFTISSSEFKAALSQVVLAASTDGQKLHLSAVLMTSTDKGIRLVATDGYRLAMRDITGTAGLSTDSFLIPARALGELQRLLDASDEITIRFNDFDATFQSPAMTLSTRLINADYPPYQTIIPKNNTNTATVNREELIDALRRTRVLASEMAPVRVRMSNEGIRLTVQLTDGSTSVEDLDARFEGEDITVAFNSEYLANGVDACGTEEVTISTSIPSKPAIIGPVGDDAYLYLLMPQRL
jgi:DNA polymerase-3 subunit beta